MKTDDICLTDYDIITYFKKMYGNTDFMLYNNIIRKIFKYFIFYILLFRYLISFITNYIISMNFIFKLKINIKQ